MSWRSKRRAVLVAATLLGALGGASAVDEVATREQATAVLQQAQEEAAEIERRYQQAQRDCAKGFVVSPCRENARRERDQQLRAAREREVAARDALRRLDADARAKARGQRAAEKAAEAERRTRSSAADMKADTPDKPARGRAPPPAVDPQKREAAAEQKRQGAAQRQAATQQRDAERIEEGERRAAERAQKEADAAERAAQLEERQRAAQARAEEKARTAEENRRRRERREQERDAARKPSDGSSGR
jgi:IgA-specific serine endopeptidase